MGFAPRSAAPCRRCIRGRRPAGTLRSPSSQASCTASNASALVPALSPRLKMPPRPPPSAARRCLGRHAGVRAVVRQQLHQRRVGVLGREQVGGGPHAVQVVPLAVVEPPGLPQVRVGAVLEQNRANSRVSRLSMSGTGGMPLPELGRRVYESWCRAVQPCSAALGSAPRSTRCFASEKCPLVTAMTRRWCPRTARAPRRRRFGLCRQGADGVVHVGPGREQRIDRLGLPARTANRAPTSRRSSARRPGRRAR